jgi:purine-nucleoside phosphorylase
MYEKGRKYKIQGVGKGLQVLREYATHLISAVAVKLSSNVF